MSNINYQYYVEGQNEKRLINTLKTELKCIKSGKVEILNVIQEKFTKARIRTLKNNTIVILVYDTDVEQTQNLKRNIDFLKNCKAVKKVLCIPQVDKLEDELARACNIKNARNITNSDSVRDFKRDLTKCRNLASKLKLYNFDINQFWNKLPENGFRIFGNYAEEIKILKIQKDGAPAA